MKFFFNTSAGGTGGWLGGAGVGSTEAARRGVAIAGLAGVCIAALRESALASDGRVDNLRVTVGAAAAVTDAVSGGQTDAEIDRRAGIGVVGEIVAAGETLGATEVGGAAAVIAPGLVFGHVARGKDAVAILAVVPCSECFLEGAIVVHGRVALRHNAIDGHADTRGVSCNLDLVFAAFCLPSCLDLVKTFKLCLSRAVLVEA